LYRAQQAPAVRHAFTATSASWLNMVERFFRDISGELTFPTLSATNSSRMTAEQCGFNRSTQQLG
jgi:hypothetical protein